MSAPEQFHDLSFEQLDDATIRLSQTDYSGDVSLIHLHPFQIRHVAEWAGLLEPKPKPTESHGLPTGLVRRLLRLQTDVGYLASNIWLDEICERLGDGLAYRIGMTAVMDTINDLLLDAGIVADTDDGADGVSKTTPSSVQARS